MLLMIRAVLYLIAAANVCSTVALTAITFTMGMIALFKGLIGSRVYRKITIDMLDTLFYWNILFLAVFTWYSLDSNREAAAYVSVIITFFALLLIVVYHLYTHTTVFSKLKGTKAGRMVDRLLTESETKQKADQQSYPLDDDIHRFNELLDMIDRPVNTNDYKAPNRQNQVGPTQSVVEVHKPYLAPPDPEESIGLQEEKGEPVCR